jgi:ergothioneine biosynthesis protein EgtB
MPTTPPSSATGTLPLPADASALARRYAAVRSQSTALAEGLSEADCQAQSMADASPVKWHLGHTTWFFETFVLERFESGFQQHHPAFRVLFNSYYNGIGDQHPRPQRGLITRPGLAEVLAWRQAVDGRVAALLHAAAEPVRAALAPLVALGLQHEQQHQELLLTDLLHLFGCNPLAPAWRPLPVLARPASEAGSAAVRWLPQDGGLVAIGHAGDGFAFDNEGPRHSVFLRSYALAQRPVSQAQWADFIDDGGYADPRWWLAAGWDWVRSQRIAAPLHWRASGQGGGGTAGWQQFTLHGLLPLDAQAPVAHISGYEAEAFTAWWSAQHPGGAPARLPTEAEWEHAAAQPTALATLADARASHFVDSGAVLPLPAAHAGTDADGDGLQQLYGDVWEWTASPYTPYPGFRAWDGAVGEYNAKFMVDQRVLRGGSCASPRDHLRASYRNFFPMGARWQFSGLRLARDLD